MLKRCSLSFWCGLYVVQVALRFSVLWTQPLVSYDIDVCCHSQLRTRNDSPISKVYGVPWVGTNTTTDVSASKGQSNTHPAGPGTQLKFAEEYRRNVSSLCRRNHTNQTGQKPWKWAGQPVQPRLRTMLIRWYIQHRNEKAKAQGQWRDSWELWKLPLG